MIIAKEGGKLSQERDSVRMWSLTSEQEREFLSKRIATDLPHGRQPAIVAQTAVRNLSGVSQGSTVARQCLPEILLPSSLADGVFNSEGRV